MGSYALAEQPLKTADEDRLGVARHAHKLAEMLEDVELPFTIGIYGPWGAGKTSFANILIDDLGKLESWKGLKPVSFSAWPYITADAIWRALLEELAAEIFGCKRVKTDEEDADEAWRPRLRRAALAEALTLRPEPRDPARKKYDKLIAQLDRTGAVANRTPDPSASMTAMTDFLVEVAATVAPGIAPIRRLFGTPEGDAATGVGNGAGAARRSIEDLREELQDLFAHDPGARIVVLLDDLDRCQPQVALDVLETIKIFLFESAAKDEAKPDQPRAQCLFLVAADQRLVAQGLRARLGSAVPEEEARAYLEKIVQLGVDLPAVELAGAHNLVAEWAPEWAAAADLIVAGLDGNPRRMKQQCSLLSYRFSALEHDEADAEPSEDRPLRRALHKLARLRAVCPEVVPLLLDPEADLGAHEAMGSEPADSDPEGPLAELLRARPRVRALFAAAPSLADIPPTTLAVLAAAPDIRPGPDGQPIADDRVFTHMARTVAAQHGTTKVERLNTDYLQAVLRLGEALPNVLSVLHSLARDRAKYVDAVERFDDWLDEDPDGDEDVELTPPGAQRLVELCGPALAAERRSVQGEPLRTVLTQSPRLSEIPLEHVRTVHEKHVVEAVAARGTDRTSGLYFALMKQATKMLRSTGRRRVLEAAIDARLQVAKDIVERRKFVKLQLLRTRWDEFAELGQSAPIAKRCRNIEKAVLHQDPDIQLSEADRALAADDTLRKLLSVPPFFDEMLGTDVVSLTATPEQRPSVPAEPATVAAPSPAPEPYVEIQLGIQPAGTGDPAEVTLELVHDGRTSSGTIRFLVADFARRVEHLAAVYLEGGTSTITRDVRAPTVSVSEVLNDLGSTLWSTTIGAVEAIREPFEAVLAQAPRVRLVINTDEDPRLAVIPWECLYVPAERVLAGLSLKLSVIRAVKKTASPAAIRSARPLRVLAVSSSPTDSPLPGAAQEIEILRQALGSIDRSVMRLEVVEDATHETLQRALRTFSPHVFHFVGHGFVRAGDGYLVLLDGRGRAAEISAEAMGIMLRDQGIMLALLNGCATGSTETDDLAGGVGQTLVDQGVPAVVATTRAIMDQTALRFAGEFYRALADGYSAETAVVEGRKALAVHNWDWSAYVTYKAPGVRLEELHAPDVRTAATAPAYA